MESFEKTLEDAAKNGLQRVIVPGPKLGDLFFHDDKQTFMAEHLKKKGFDVRKIRTNCGGVIQEPSWYLYLY